MTTLVRTLAVILLLAVFPASSSAQDSATVGLVMATPASVSVIWHVSDAIALRPEIGFTTSSTSAKGPGAAGAKTDASTVSPGFSVLFYLHRWDALRTYVSPRYVYSRAHAESTSQGGSSESTASSHTVAGSIGAEYALHRHFGVFGELGISYAHADAPTTSSDSWTHRTAVGAILYF
jgi:outer membrane protein W